MTGSHVLTGGHSGGYSAAGTASMGEWSLCWSFKPEPCLDLDAQRLENMENENGFLDFCLISLLFHINTAPK